jgi:hypothetical protein
MKINLSIIFYVIFLCFCLFFAASARAEQKSGLDSQITSSAKAQPAAGANPNIIKFTPHMTVASLTARANADLVELPNGRYVKVGTIRNFEAAAKIMRTPRVNKMPAELKHLPDGNNFRTVKTANDLSAALKLPDSATVKLPSGRFATVGQIKFVQQMVDKKSGNKLTEISRRQDLSGPAIAIPKDMAKIMTKAEQEKFWENILQKPDSTILEAPNGRRITVSQLKQGLTTNNKSTPRKTAPQPIKQRRPI